MLWAVKLSVKTDYAARAVLDSPALEDDQCAEVLQQAWGEVRSSVNAAADNITFDNLLEARNRDEEMYYI